MTLSTTQISAETLERVLISGDLSPLTPKQRLEYYQRVCDSLGLNPLTKPFDYIDLGHWDKKANKRIPKLILYAKKDATDQLRDNHKVSIVSLEGQMMGENYVVTAKAQDATGRTDISTGVVCLTGLAGEDLANALMRTETKAKRRVTLSICGLGWLDETETETIKEAKVITVNHDTGEIIPPKPALTAHPDSLTPFGPNPYYCQPHNLLWEKQARNDGSLWWINGVEVRAHMLPGKTKKSTMDSWCFMPDPQLLPSEPPQDTAPTMPPEASEIAAAGRIISAAATFASANSSDSAHALTVEEVKSWVTPGLVTDIEERARVMDYTTEEIKELLGVERDPWYQSVSLALAWETIKADWIAQEEGES